MILGGFSAYFNRYLLEPSTHPYSLFTRYFRQVILFGLVGIPINMLLLKLLEANEGHLLIIISIIFFNVTLSAFLRNLLTSINIFQKVRFFVSFNLLALSLGLF